MSAETKPTVQEAWAAVMGDVRELGKDSLHNSPGARFNFRGVDDVMNAVGPVLRKHKVAVIPTGVELVTRDTQTSTGKPAQEATVRVTYAIHGPAGDSMPGGSAGGAMDNGDKATPKAMSVAYRTFLLQALCLPTHETDPDAEAFERGQGGPSRNERAQMYANGLPNCADPAALERVRVMAQDEGLLDAQVSIGDRTMILAEAFGIRAQQLAQAVAS